MRKLAIGLALASTALASPALARDGQWYVGVEGGAMLVEDIELGITRGASSTTAVFDNDTGYDFGGIVGYDFGAFRLESEVSYREADIEGTSGTFPTGAGNTIATGTFRTTGDANALSFMLNGLFDFGADDGLQGFVGGGVGVARVDVHNILSSPTWLDDSDTGIAWQALAGIRAPLSDSWDVGLKYRYFNAPNVDLVDRLGAQVGTSFKSHSLLGSLIYNFGGEPEPVPYVEPPKPPMVVPPPPRPPEPPKVVKTCSNGPYIVFFDWDKSDLTPQGASTLDNAISQYANCGSAKVMLAGHADRSGATSYNVGLSQRRNTTVRSYLEANGISGGVIATEAFGESQNLIATADGVREGQNRRVEVSYGPGSGN